MLVNRREHRTAVIAAITTLPLNLEVSYCTEAIQTKLFCTKYQESVSYAMDILI
jgi:hypothetical protein